MTKHRNAQQAALPDILRPTELHDFGDVFERGRHRRKALGLVLAVLGLWAVSEVAPEERLQAERPGRDDLSVVGWPSLNDGDNGVYAALTPPAH